MSNSLSTRALLAILAAETSDVFIVLAEISGSGMDTIRIAANTEDVTSGGNTYTAFPFSVKLPIDSDDSPLRAEMTACNVDRQIVTGILQLGAAPDVEINVVIAATPDTIELGPLAFKAYHISFGAAVIRLSLEYEDAKNELIPTHRQSPSNFPGLFKA